ncbi:unnamed protein product [Closterium sp. NIES-64]|nr:unnamed protein product [Closterium sp. NIES-64]
MFEVGLQRWRAVRRPLGVFVTSAFLLLLLSLAWLPASRSQDAQIGGAGGGDGAGSGGDAGDGAASGLADFIGGYAGDAGNGLSNAGESGSGGSGTGDSGDSGSGNGESGRASNGKFKGVFELPDPPSRFNARAAWHHMRYRTPDSCWSQQERHLYHTADQPPSSQADQAPSAQADQAPSAQADQPPSSQAFVAADQSHPSQAFVDAVVAFEAMQRECVSQGRVEDWQWVRNRKDWCVVGWLGSPTSTHNHPLSPLHCHPLFLLFLPVFSSVRLPSPVASLALQLLSVASPRPGVHMARAGQATLDQGVPRYGPDRKPCRYIMIHDLSRGVGNRIVSYVTSFVLGLLTNRVIIAPPNGFLTRRFCNPFARANTSWTVQPAVYELNAKSMNAAAARKRTLSFALLPTPPQSAAGGRSGKTTDSVLLAAAVPNPRLHLSDMAERLKKASMWKRVPAATRHLEGEVAQKRLCVDRPSLQPRSIDVYFLPSLYYIQSYADRLHELFPDRRVFTHVARFLMHPDNRPVRSKVSVAAGTDNNRLWVKIAHTFLANLGHYPHRLGVQIRSPDGIDLPVANRILECAIRSPDGIDLPVANRILRCAVRAQYLPSTQPYPEDPSMATPAQRYPGGGAGDGGGDVETYRSFRTMGVFVSSLNIRHMLDLETHYAQHLTIGNTFVSFWSLTNEGRETRQGAAADRCGDGHVDSQLQLVGYGGQASGREVWASEKGCGVVFNGNHSDQDARGRLAQLHGARVRESSSEPCDSLGAPVKYESGSGGRGSQGGGVWCTTDITVIKMRGIDWRNSTGPVCERVSSEPCDTLGAPVRFVSGGWVNQAANTVGAPVRHSGGASVIVTTMRGANRCNIGGSGCRAGAGGTTIAAG